MITVVLLCSGQPDYRREGDGSVRCWNAAVVRLVKPCSWRRPMCGDCAIEFDRRMRRDGMTQPLFEELENREAAAS